MVELEGKKVKMGSMVLPEASQRRDRAAIWSKRRDMAIPMLFVWMMLFGLVSWLIYSYIHAEGVKTRKEALGGMCEERARMLQDQFLVSMNHVHALAILVSKFHHGKTPSAIDQRTFAEYAATTAFERPLLSGVAYAQKVMHSERELFERQQGWAIKTMKREPSPVRDEYAPAIFSQETVSYLESLDMMSGEEDRENIERARATGKAVLTSPFRLLESNHLGVVLTFPVYRESLPADATVQERIQATAGYLGGAFDVESLVENLLRKLVENEAIVVNVYDITNASMPLIMYGPQGTYGDMSLTHVSLLDFGDPFRKHQMTCRFLQNPPAPWMAIMFAGCFFVIFGLVGYIFYAAITHIAKVEEDFYKMEELKVQAESAAVAKSQFLATVSHEIRTPMNGVLGMLRMLLDTNLDSTQKEYARTAQASGKALIALINEVLDRAKIESGKLELDVVPFDLRSVLDDVLSLFSGKSRDKGIEVGVFVSDKVPEILFGDPGRFRQIITNLVGNSVKFTERGHVLVQVHLADHVKNVLGANFDVVFESTEDESGTSRSSIDTFSGYKAADDRNTWEKFKLLLSDSEKSSENVAEWTATISDSDTVTLMISIEDTGIGIPLHAQERVFLPFMQADSSTSRTYGGTGIGLSICKCLVELMGGKIKFVSREHVGSTFTCTIVLKRYEKGSSDDLKLPVTEPLPRDFQGMKAVVVDGRPIRAAVTKYHLQRLGIAVRVASNIDTAFDLLSGKNGYSKNGKVGRKPDMILVEKESWCSLESFPACLQDFKQNDRIFELPKMILLANSVNSGEPEKAKSEGFVDTVVMKPLRAKMVASSLQPVFAICTMWQLGTGMTNGKQFLQSVLLGKNILVVDDNRVNQRVAAFALKKYGANVECVDSGKSALSKLQIPHKFDACFMDIQMPEMDGFQATRRIRLLESEANEKIGNGSSGQGLGTAEWHIHILAMTADLIQATYEECIKCGMDGYVTKPFEEEQLYRAVAKFFDEKPTEDD